MKLVSCDKGIARLCILHELKEAIYARRGGDKFMREIWEMSLRTIPCYTVPVVN